MIANIGTCNVVTCNSPRSYSMDIFKRLLGTSSLYNEEQKVLGLLTLNKIV